MKNYEFPGIPLLANGLRRRFLEKDPKFCTEFHHINHFCTASFISYLKAEECKICEHLIFSIIKHKYV